MELSKEQKELMLTVCNEDQELMYEILEQFRKMSDDEKRTFTDKLERDIKISELLNEN